MQERKLTAVNILDIKDFRSKDIEQFHTILKSRNIEIEQIVSFGKTTPKGEWYDQDWDEWVLVMQGTAELTFDAGRVITMKQGDYLLLEKNIRHRVSSASEDCIWLAVHIK